MTDQCQGSNNGTTQAGLMLLMLFESAESECHARVSYYAAVQKDTRYIAGRVAPIAVPSALDSHPGSLLHKYGPLAHAFESVRLASLSS